MLFNKFQIDFADWTPELWEIAYKFAAKNLRNQLIALGVLVPR
jgi:hypothetical protein